MIQPARNPADDLLDAAMPATGWAVMLNAYFDESGRTGGIFAVAGWAYDRRQARKCRKDWSQLFQKYGECHMTDLALKQKQFEGISDKEAGRLIQRAISIINKCASFGVAISCDSHELESFLPKWIQGFEGAYPVCCHVAMTMLGGLVEETEEIAYFFESGHRHQKQAHRFMSRVLDTPELKKSYRHYSHTFADKKDMKQLQTADVLAWEWAKFFDETVIKDERRMRKSLESLITKGGMTPDDYNTDYFKGMHITGAPLRKFCAQVTQMGLLQLAEDAGA
jgi:hypothetical protein